MHRKEKARSDASLKDKDAQLAKEDEEAHDAWHELAWQVQEYATRDCELKEEVGEVDILLTSESSLA